MSSLRNLKGVAAAAALVAAIVVAGTPAHAVVTHNSITHNALATGGSAIDDLNGVAVKAVTPPGAAVPGGADGARPGEGLCPTISAGTHGGGGGNGVG